MRPERARRTSLRNGRREVLLPDGKKCRDLTYRAPDRLRLQSPDDGSDVWQVRQSAERATAEVEAVERSRLARRVRERDAADAASAPRSTCRTFAAHR